MPRTKGRTKARNPREYWFKEQKGFCLWCKLPMRRVGKAGNPVICTAEHLVRKVHKGSYARKNIRAVHRFCNNYREQVRHELTVYHYRQAILTYVHNRKKLWDFLTKGVPDA